MEEWSERQDSNLRRLAPKASALARLSYAPTAAGNIRGTAAFRNDFLGVQNPSSKLQIPNSKFQVQGSKFQIANSRGGQGGVGVRADLTWRNL